MIEHHYFAFLLHENFHPFNFTFFFFACSSSQVTSVIIDNAKLIKPLSDTLEAVC